MEALLCVVLSFILVVVIVFLLSPVFLQFDTEKKFLYLSWMGLSIRPRWVLKKPKAPRIKPKRVRKLDYGAIGLRLFNDTDLVVELLQKSFRSLKGLYEAVSIRSIDASFSTPDPMWNGMLYGLCANLYLEKVSFSLNFENVNYVRGGLQFYPYRIVKVAVGLLVRLPYRRIIGTVLYFRRHSRKESVD